MLFNSEFFASTELTGTKLFDDSLLDGFVNNRAWQIQAKGQAIYMHMMISLVNITFYR